MVGYDGYGMTHAYVVRRDNAVVCITASADYAARVAAVLDLDAKAVTFEPHDWGAI